MTALYARLRRALLLDRLRYTLASDDRPSARYRRAAELAAQIRSEFDGHRGAP